LTNFGFAAVWQTPADENCPGCPVLKFTPLLIPIDGAFGSGEEMTKGRKNQRRKA
jgi:hypothetical protein